MHSDFPSVINRVRLRNSVEAGACVCLWLERFFAKPIYSAWMNRSSACPFPVALSSVFSHPIIFCFLVGLIVAISTFSPAIPFFFGSCLTCLFCSDLDLFAVMWLEDYLTRYRKTLVVVSHARDFLNAVVTDIIHVHDKTITQYRGDYETFDRTRKEKMLLRMLTALCPCRVSLNPEMHAFFLFVFSNP